MARKSILNFFAVLLVLLPASTAFAQNDPEQLVVDVSRDALEILREYRPTYDDNPELLQNELLALLDPVIDFEAFSRGVMGNYRDQATDSQREQFRELFKATLVDLYTSALVATEIRDIQVRETNMRSDTSASVLVDVTAADGTSYEVSYSMRRDDAGTWKARNIIIDGVNVGLTYRNQFRSVMETENGDMERVIQIWPEVIDGA
ncbi:phospholipid-binding protein MlaC [Parvularcula sp. IMCC14364]|uniref:MlaC/ttg2D family ABC transporter substrate-binding protein n=1 Tax=Parvularcula sp. IMCC14364 TaxID=3067902 RepID=UPI00274129FB|nr:ABC transporter substrate-binding protein [Parvularcula sp. IMCC14364]